MITLKSKTALMKMTHAGQQLAQMMELIVSEIKPGVDTLILDQWIENQLKARDMVSMTKGYKGYQHSSCISLNDVIVHGVPSKNEILALGDLVKIDVCASYKGYAADLTRCFFVENVDPAVKKLVDCAQRALDAGISQMVPGKRVGDISAAIQAEVEKEGYGIVRIFAGHGIGKRMHEDPEILNYGKPGRGPILQPGMTFALEPMITMKSEEVVIDVDGWTARTKDGMFAAHVEDTIAVTNGEPKIITRL